LLSNPADLFGGSFGFLLDRAHVLRVLLSNPADLFGGSFGFLLDRAHVLRALFSNPSSARRNAPFHG
jgi:hypothetical protein